MLSIYLPFVLLKATLNTRPMDVASVHDKNNASNVDELVHSFMQQLHLPCHLRNL